MNKEILENLKELLEKKSPYSKNYVSLLTVQEISYKNYEAHQRTKTYYEYLLAKASNLEMLRAEEFNYDDNELIIKTTKTYATPSQRISTHIFKKDKEGNVVLKNHDDYEGKQLLINSNQTLSELFDKMLRFRSFNQDNVTIDNSPFEIQINNGAIILKFGGFSLSKYNYKQEYVYQSSFDNLITLVKGREDLLFDNIQIKIDDCPLYIKEELLTKDNNNSKKSKGKIKSFLNKHKNNV